MNVFWHELQARVKVQIGWVSAMLVFMVMSVAKFSTLSADTGASQALLQQFPATVQAIFGMTGLDLTTLSGYFGVLFIYILVILAIHAGMLGTSALNDEERDKTAEFLFVKPRSRARIMTPKLLVGVLYLILQWVTVGTSTVVAVSQVGSVGDFMQDFSNFMIALAVIQVTVFSIGVFVAAAMNNSRLPGKLVAIGVFASYLMFALVKLSPSLEWLKYGSIFCYFDAFSIISDGSLSKTYVIICLSAAGMSVIGAYYMFRRRDLQT